MTNEKILLQIYSNKPYGYIPKSNLAKTFDNSPFLYRSLKFEHDHNIKNSVVPIKLRQLFPNFWPHLKTKSTFFILYSHLRISIHSKLPLLCGCMYLLKSTLSFNSIFCYFPSYFQSSLFFLLFALTFSICLS